MARKQITFTATAKRDEGKEFLITEMPAAQAEDWAMRALMAAIRSGADLGDIEPGAGMAGIATIAAKSLGVIDVATARELRDELFECVKFVGKSPSGKNVYRAMQPDDIEEVATLLELRKAVLFLHIDFFTDETASTQG